MKKASGTDYDVEWSSDADLDTKNTAGATDSSQKLYIVGAPEQTANPQTYTQDTAYVGTDRKSTRLNSSHAKTSRMPSSA